MALLAKTEQVHQLTRPDFTPSGDIITEEDQVSMVVEAYREASNWMGNEAGYKLEWNDSRILYRSPRPYSTWENSFVLEPNLRRFDVAKWVNSIVPQVKSAYFYQTPPLEIIGGPTMDLETSGGRKTLMWRLMKDMGYIQQVGLLIDQWSLFGTGLGKWYKTKEEVKFRKRKSSDLQLPSGAAGATHTAKRLGKPESDTSYKVVSRLRFDFIDLNAESTVVWNPDARGGDIRLADVVIHRRMVDFYDLQRLALNPLYVIPGAVIEGFGDDDEALLREETDTQVVIAGSLINLFMPPAESQNTVAPPVAAQQNASTSGLVHGAEQESHPHKNPLRNKLEVLEYLDQRQNKVITVLNRKQRIREGEADFGYLSANYWNLPDAIVGLGIGQIGGGNQRLDQGIINAALKVLALSLNAPYLAPDSIGQVPRVLRTGIGKVLTVSEQAFASNGGYKLMETAKVDAAVWPVLQNNKAEGESATGADALMVQGSTAGPRAGGMRTAGGSNIIAGKSESRLDGPMGHLTDQVIVPFFDVLADFIHEDMSDEEITDILGDVIGKKVIDSLNAEVYPYNRAEYDILAGAKLAAKRTMAQSLVMIFEYGLNPQLQQQMSDIYGQYIDMRTIYKLLLTSSEWGQGVENEIIRDMTPEMKKANAAKQQAASEMGPQGKIAVQSLANQGRADVEDKRAQAKLLEHIIDRTLEASSLQEAVTGEPGGPGLGANE